MKTQLTDDDFTALASFRYGVRRYLAFAEAGARKVGLTTQQHQALLAMKAHTLKAEMSIGDLAAQMLVKHHTAVELVARLEQGGYIARASDPEDRRKVLLSLTAEGEAVLASLGANNLRELKVIAPGFAGIIRSLARLDKA